MAKSYAEANGHQVVDWKKELQLLIGGEESKVDLGLVEKWETCCIGQQSELIERDGTAYPEDEILRAFGCQFAVAIKGKQFEEALSICEMADVRCAFLVKKLEKTIRERIAEKKVELEELKLKLKKVLN